MFNDFSGSISSSDSWSGEYRPFLLVANSSWYLAHYRKLLIRRLIEESHHVMALSPVDSSVPDIAKLLIHIPWRIYRTTDSNPFSFFVSFIRMLFLVRAIKPSLVHAHTLKANLLAVIVTAFFGIPCVISFAGMGRLSKARGASRFAFVLVLHCIAFFALRERKSRWSWGTSICRSAFIFQNPLDLALFESILPRFPRRLNHLIYGSGVPDHYLNLNPTSTSNSRPFRNNWGVSTTNLSSSECFSCQLVFCARLLRSKGISIFLDLSAKLVNHSFTVYGGVDPSSRDSLSASEFPFLQQKYPNVFFAGALRDPLLILEDPYPVLVVPSCYGEGLPRAVVEALALGIPVIMSRSAACGIFNESIVYLSNGDAVSDYFNAFMQLLDDYAQGRLVSRLEAGRELVFCKLSETAVVQQTLDLYRAIQDQRDDSYFLNKDSFRLKHWLAQ